MTHPSDPIKVSRREFLTISSQIAAGALFAAPLRCLASVPQFHQLSFYHTHTGETLDLHFDLHKGAPDNVKDMNHFMRDFRTGDIHPIDNHLIDQLCHLQIISNSSGTFELISGYRSPTTNMKLMQTTSGIAKKSLHMKGRAIDIRLTDIPTKKLKSLACSLQRGGVGYYPKSNFIHLDTGRYRTW